MRTTKIEHFGVFGWQHDVDMLPAPIRAFGQTPERIGRGDHDDILMRQCGGIDRMMCDVPALVSGRIDRKKVMLFQRFGEGSLIAGLRASQRHRQDPSTGGIGACHDLR